MINRSEIINIMKENEINISRDNINLKEIKKVLEKILEKLNSVECITDSRFIPYGRMELLIDELDKNIENKIYIDAYYNISDFLSDSRISLNNNPEVVDKNKEYYNEDKICKEEQIIIIEMIDKYLSSINNVLEEKTININKKEILKNICDNLNESIDNFEMSRLDEINADIFTLKDNQRGLGGIIIGDDGSSLVCGSIYPISHYIDEFKNEKTDKIGYDESLKLSNGKYAADQETKEAFEKYMEEIKAFNDKVERGENPRIKQDELLAKYQQLFYDESLELRLKKTEEDFNNREKDAKINDLINKIDDKLNNINKDEYHSLFEKDDNDAFIRLIIPANEPTNDYPNELNLIGKLPQDFTTDEVIRMKKYSQKMYDKINNKDNFDYKLQIIESSWSGWTKNYIPEEKINKYDIKLNKKYSINNGHLEFEVIEIYDDNIVIKTTKSFSDSKEAVNLNSKKTEFTIYSNEETKLITPTMDAGEIYSLKLVKEDN